LLSFNDSSSAIAPDEWLQHAQPTVGSWWPVWQQWLVNRSSPNQVSPPPMGNGAEGYWPGMDAPGEYVMQR
jgi:polyhydroxyalkanoate synthase